MGAFASNKTLFAAGSFDRIVRNFYAPGIHRSETGRIDSWNLDVRSRAIVLAASPCLESASKSLDVSQDLFAKFVSVARSGLMRRRPSNPSSSTRPLFGCILVVNKVNAMSS